MAERATMTTPPGPRDAIADQPERLAALEEARECLRYWERRAAELPVRARSERREAREMATRWRERAARAEDEVYGGGMLGAVLLLAAERRLPEHTRHRGQRVVRTGVRVATGVVLVVLMLVVLAVAAAVGLLVAIF